MSTALTASLGPLSAASAQDLFTNPARANFLAAERQLSAGLVRGLGAISPQLVDACHKIGALFRDVLPFLQVGFVYLSWGMTLATLVVVPIGLYKLYHDRRPYQAMRILDVFLIVLVTVKVLNTALLALA
jgi:hypothetical protein